jgi:ectoine hydroxylase-related dioxygenase (phytanoyl-CoA dioxygenase family)
MVAQPELAPGDVLIRDLSLVHNGVGNPSVQDRPLLAIVVKPDGQSVPDHMVSDVPRRVFDTLDADRRRLLRRHRVVAAPSVRSRPYPMPEMREPDVSVDRVRRTSEEIR